MRNERHEYSTALHVSPEQVKDIVERSCLGTLPPEELPFLDRIRGDILARYSQRYPVRERLLIGFLSQGSNVSAIARDLGINGSLARRWIRHYLRVSALRLHRAVEQGNDQEILRSICSLTHGRAERSASGYRVSLRARVCPGCIAGIYLPG